MSLDRDRDAGPAGSADGGGSIEVPDSGSDRVAAPPVDGIDAPFGEPVACEDPSCLSVPPNTPLEIRFLGVGGFSISRSGDRVMSAPMYTNPSLATVLSGTIHSDPASIDRFSIPSESDAQAILVGHAHYDHLLDVPHVWSKTRGATIYGNLSMKRILAALAPDKAPACASSTISSPGPMIPRDKVVAIDDPADDRVDYRLCAEPQSRCPGAYDGRAGEWISVPDSNVRIRGLCSQHPDQFLIFHFGSGCIDEDLCALPDKANDWREGGTIAYLVDFLDPRTGEPIFRVYYQDAPTDAPVGHVHPELLAEKRVDVALLCVGNYDQVGDHPGEIIRALDPRYVIAGHWESFFKQQSEPPEDIPFLDVAMFTARMTAAMPAGGEAPVSVNGTDDSNRSWLPAPGDVFEIVPETSPRP